MPLGHHFIPSLRNSLMRRVVGAIALLFIGFSSHLVHPFSLQARPWQAAANESVQLWFRIKSAEISDAGANAPQVAVLRACTLSRTVRATCQLICSPLPIQNNILILSFPSAPGVMNCP